MIAVFIPYCDFSLIYAINFLVQTFIISHVIITYRDEWDVACRRVFGVSVSAGMGGRTC